MLTEVVCVHNGKVQAVLESAHVYAAQLVPRADPEQHRALLTISVEERKSEVVFDY